MLHLLPYILILSSLVAAAFKPARATILPFILIVLFFFLSLRSNFGNDYDRYLQIFSELKGDSDDYMGGRSPVFTFIMTSLPTWRSFILLTTLFYSCTVLTLIRLTLRPAQYFLALLFWFLNPYLLLYQLSGIRAATASTLFLVSCFLLFHYKAYVYSALFCFAAAATHFTFVYLPLILLLVTYQSRVLNSRPLLFAPTLLVIWASSFLFIRTFLPTYLITNISHYASYLNLDNVPSLEQRTLIILAIEAIIICYLAVRVGSTSPFAWQYLLLLNGYCGAISFSFFVSLSTVLVEPLIMLGIFAIPNLYRDSVRYLGVQLPSFLFSILYLIQLIRFLRFIADPVWEYGSFDLL